MRAMRHSSRSNRAGRVHGTKHNDRNFDISKAENINVERAVLNVYENVYMDENLTFEEAELRFYNENFSEQLDAINSRNIAQRHPERVRTMEEWKRIRQNAPEEVTMQIGKLEEHVSREVLFDCYSDYAMRMEKWNEEHGHPFTILTRALHADEAVPHVQERRVWHWRSEDGDLRIGQERALRQAGLDLPHPDRPESRRNNRKMVFDAMAREVWLDVLHDHGLEIEREPVPNGRHNREKEDVIRDKYEALLEENKRLAAQNEQLQHDIQELTATKDYAEQQLAEATDALFKTEDQHVEKKLELRAVETRIDELKQLIPATWEEYDIEAKRAWGLLDALRLKMQEVFNSRRIFRNRKEEGKLLKAVEDARDALLASLSALTGFEAIKHVPDPQRRSSVIRRTLDEMMKEADRERDELPAPRRNRRDRDDRDL